MVKTAKSKMEPKDYASLAFSLAELKERIKELDSYKKITGDDRLPGFRIEVSVQVEVKSPLSGGNNACFELLV